MPTASARGYPDQVPLRLDLAEPRVDLAPLAAALAEGACAVIPTDTVYGLVCDAGQPEACARLSALKGRDPAPAVDRHVRDASRPPRRCSRRSSPGSRGAPGRCSARGATVLVPNPGGRYPHLCGDDPQRIGVRVSAFPPALARAIDARRRDPRDLGQPARRARPAHARRGPGRSSQRSAPCCVDGGPAAAGRASTVLDLSAARPVILREGALATADALALIA